MTFEESLKEFPFLSEDAINELKAVGFDDNHMESFYIVEHFIKNGNLEQVKNFIENGTDVNSSENGDFGSSLLHIAIRYGQMEVFNYLIEKGADINFVDNVGWTPLMESVVDDKPEFGKALVEKGANQQFVNQRGATAKALASKFGRQSFLSFLQ